MVVKSGQLEIDGFTRRVESCDLRGTAHAGMSLGWRPEHEISSTPRHALPHVTALLNALLVFRILKRKGYQRKLSYQRELWFFQVCPTWPAFASPRLDTTRRIPMLDD